MLLLKIAARKQAAELLQRVLTKKTLKTQLGAVGVRDPGIETENTSRRLSAKYSRNADGMEEKILGLYVCGMSQRDVSE